MNKTNLLIDLGVFAGFLVVDEPGLTGLSLHEWLGLALTCTLLVHILLHWKWITTIGLQFFRNLFQNSRLKFVLDALLFIAFDGVMLSGVMISRTLAIPLGLQIQTNPTWRTMHSLAANLLIYLVALHIALNWPWIAKIGQRYLINPLRSVLRRPQQPAVVPVEIDEK
jgi:hypothetical protein